MRLLLSSRSRPVHILRPNVRIPYPNSESDHTKFISWITTVANVFKAFDVEFKPYIDEINEREQVIRECADAATMDRIRSKCDQCLNIIR